MATSGVPVWQPDHDVTECPICDTRFTFFFRKHHCRMCGRVVCGNCSPGALPYLATSYVVSPPSQPFLESPHIPHRTCVECAEELAMIRRALSHSPAPGPGGSAGPALPLSREARDLMVQSVIPGPDMDQLARCPVCDAQLFNLPIAAQEMHVDECLNKYTLSPSTAGGGGGPHRKRVLISRLPAKESTSLGDCTICYEDFEPGQSIGRLECLCVFHEKCIFEWFARKGMGNCPLHNQGE